MAVPAYAPFKSAEDKRRFTRWAVLGGLGLGLAVLAAIGVSMVQMLTPGFQARGDSPGAYGAAQWRGEEWALLRDGGSGGGGRFQLYRQAGAGPLRRVAAFEAKHEVYLLGGPQDPAHLWLLGVDKAGRVDAQGAVQWLAALPAQAVGDVGRPFFAAGRPALMAHAQGAAEVWSLDGGRWRRDGPWQLQLPPSGADKECDCGRLKATFFGGRYQWFYKLGGTLRHFAGSPQGHDRQVAGWEALSTDAADLNWAPVALPGGLMLVDHARGADEATVRVWQAEGGRWRCLARVADPAESAGLQGLGPQDYVLVTAHPGLALRNGRGAAVGAPRVLLRAPEPLWLLLIALLPGLSVAGGSLLLLFLLQAGLKRHRAPARRLAGRVVVYAPLWRRALTHVVDGALIAATGMGLMAALVVAVVADKPKGVDASVWLMLGAFATAAGGALAVALGLVWAEGRSGKTLGRWVSGTRVLGSDLKPCGPGRALLRALLGAIDGVGMGAVGAFLACYSPRYQRLGDRLADTVVLMDLDD